ncbi:MAG: DsbE family thiol:disulfide interchange protein [Gammaproteobacteria bacterium]
MARYLIPLAIFVTLVVFFAIGLTKDPRLVPSPLIGKAAPQFTLPTLKDPQRSLSTADLRGHVTLFNVWASWCVECRVEHPFLMDLARNQHVAIYGLNYKDTRAAALTWLDNMGDPYHVIAFDQKGSVGIDWGVYGVPETFVVDKKGVIRWKVIGPLTPKVWKDKVEPLVRKLQEERG